MWASEHRQAAAADNIEMRVCTSGDPMISPLKLSKFMSNEYFGDIQLCF